MNTPHSASTAQTNTEDYDASPDSAGQKVSFVSIIQRQAVRLPLLLGLHLVLFSLIYAFAFFARFNFQPTPNQPELFLATVGPVVFAKLAVFYFCSYFHGWWRYVTFADLQSLLKVALLSMIVVAFVDYFLLPFTGSIPRLSILLDALTTVIVIGGLRCTWRFADETFNNTLPSRRRRPAILVGTGFTAGKLASQINANPSMPCRINALLATDTKYRRKATLGGVPVLGCLDDMVSVAEKVGASDILVPSGSLDGATLRKLTEKCNQSELTIRVLPRFEDAMAGTQHIPLRPLDIEDLLRRAPVELDTNEVESVLTGKRIMVTGAGGSIGSEICRQVMKFGPRELILLGRGENRIHAIYGELKPIAEAHGVQLHIEIGDITDEPRMRRLFETRSPQIVFHAAAHKHVPLMELHPGEAVKNNINGTRVVASFAKEFGVDRFVMVSTDKVVNPTSIMGCTKHLAERVIYEFAQSNKTKFAVVRFGNVLGSAGSVIPHFQEQVRRGGPITVTDPRMTRYFMSIPEASQLVIQSGAMCKGGEIFVLDMGEPVRIVQLAEDLVSLSGLPAGSIEIEFVGIRPGEKLYEELYFQDEETIPTSHPKVRAAYPRDFQGSDISEEITALIASADGDPAEVAAAIVRLVPSFRPDSDPVETADEPAAPKQDPSLAT